MSRKAARRILWISFVLMLPVPILLTGPGLVPAARLFMLGAISLLFAVVENSRGAIGMLSVILLTQSLIYMGLLWLVAHALSRVLGRFPPTTVARVTLALVVAGLLVTSTFEVYHGPYRAETPSANLLHVYE